MSRSIPTISAVERLNTGQQVLLEKLRYKIEDLAEPQIGVTMPSKQIVKVLPVPSHPLEIGPPS